MARKVVTPFLEIGLSEIAPNQRSVGVECESNLKITATFRKPALPDVGETDTKTGQRAVGLDRDRAFEGRTGRGDRRQQTRDQTDHAGHKTNDHIDAC